MSAPLFQRQMRELERVESRVLAALRFIDAATEAPIATPMQLLSLDGRANFIRNQRGMVVLDHWSGLGAHRDAFETPPALPAVGSLTLRIAVTDPAGVYLPRIVSLALPRDPTVVDPDPESSLFEAVRVPMYPTAAATTGANWSLLRVSLSEDGSGDALGGALLRVRRNGDVIARGMTDWRGEGLVAVVGVPVMTFGDDEEAVVVEAINVSLEVVFDPDSGSRLSAASLRDRRLPPPQVLVDPVAMEAAAAELPHSARSLSIAARRTQSVAMTLQLP